jgi:hypothetical protein
MAKNKPVRDNKKKSAAQKPTLARDLQGAIPCLLLVTGIIALVGYLFYAMLKSAS